MPRDDAQYIALAIALGRDRERAALHCAPSCAAHRSHSGLFDMRRLRARLRRAATADGATPSQRHAARGHRLTPGRAAARARTKARATLARMTAATDFCPLPVRADGLRLAHAGQRHLRRLSRRRARARTAIGCTNARCCPTTAIGCARCVSQWIADDARRRHAGHRRHRLHRPRFDARSVAAAARQGDAGLRRDVPRDELRGDRHLVAAVARVRRAGQRHVRVLPAGLDVGLPHRVGKDHPRATRCAHADPATSPRCGRD